MSPLTVFFRTLLKSSAIFIGTAAIFLHPSLEWRGVGDRTIVGAQPGARQAAIAALLVALNDPDTSVRSSAAAALHEIQTPVLSAATAGLSSPDPAARTRAACTLRELGREAAPALAKLAAMLDDGSTVEGAICGERTWRFRGGGERTSPGEQAASAMVAIGSAAYSPFAKALTGPAWIARRNAAWGLGALNASEAVPALIEALKDPEASVREQVAWALGAIGDHRAVDGLVGALSDSSPAVRRQAAWALGAIGDRGAVPGLMKALKDNDSGVRRQAAWALGAIGG
jgi:HEAT repeat protein